MPRFRLALDTGGTFTDVVAFDEETGRVHTTKTPTTPADPSVGFMAGVHKIARQAGFGLNQAEISGVSHGTTVATNALLAEEGSFPGLGLIVTHGFKHVLEIARQSVPESYGNSYFWVKPERIVPLHLVREVPERLDAEGRTVLKFDEDEAVEVARWFKKQGIRAVGICFLHAYANPGHEQRMRDVLAREHPGCAVSLSSEILNEYREYERSVTTLIDAFLKPKVAAYTARIARRLDELHDTSAAATPPIPV